VREISVWRKKTTYGMGLSNVDSEMYMRGRYCTNEDQPVTTHDLLEGEEAEYQEYTLVRFDLDLDGERVVAPMATLRPETVRGVTNAYVHPDAEYVRATVDGEAWVVSAAAVEKFRLQDREVSVEERFEGARLVGREVTNPVTGDEVPILPATFVDPDNATGVVMSVPAHSPDDYLALREAKADPDRMRAYGVDPATVTAIEPVPILDIEGYGEIPAADAVAEYDIASTDDPALEEATKELYNREFHAGPSPGVDARRRGELRHTERCLRRRTHDTASERRSGSREVGRLGERSRFGVARFHRVPRHGRQHGGRRRLPGRIQRRPKAGRTPADGRRHRTADRPPSVDR
jgi:leucyl-tRNA synthetase